MGRDSEGQIAVSRLSVDRSPDGYRDAEGRLVLQNARYMTVVPCMGCGEAKRCGWCTGHGPPIRWCCDDCAGTPCGAGTWEDPYWAIERGRHVMVALGPDEILAPPALDRDVADAPCPACGLVADHPPAVRQSIERIGGMEWGVADIGWRCRNCGHEWGFEGSRSKPTPPYLDEHGDLHVTAGMAREIHEAFREAESGHRRDMPPMDAYGPHPLDFDPFYNAPARILDDRLAEILGELRWREAIKPRLRRQPRTDDGRSLAPMLFGMRIIVDA